MRLRTIRRQDWLALLVLLAFWPAAVFPGPELLGATLEARSTGHGAQGTGHGDPSAIRNPQSAIRNRWGAAALAGLGRAVERVLDLVCSPAEATETTLQPDPTAGKDALVAQNNPTTNYGDNVALASGFGQDFGGMEKRSYLQFDLSSIPQGATINSATLSLYVSGATGSQTAGVYKVTSSWTEGGVTWNNPPTANGTAEATTAVGSTGWKSWTITDLVADWHDGTVTNYGVQVKKSSGSPPDNVQFHSSDYTTDTTRRPKLVVDYTAGNGQPPTAVTLNDLSNITSYSVDLSWSQNQDEDFASYKIYRDTSAGVDTNDTLVTTLTTQSTTSYTNTGLSPSTTYYYKVYVFDTESLSSGSNEKSGTTQQNTAPTAVTLNDLSNLTSSSVDLSWSQNQDGDFASYKIYRDTSAGVDTNDTLVTTITNQGTTSYTNTGLSPSTTYYYKVYVFDTGDLSSGSNEKSGTTPANQPPAAVTLNLPTNITGSSMNLTWSENEEEDFASYKIYRDTSAGVDTNDTLVTTLTNQSTTSYTNNNLSAGTAYYYKVYVVDTGELSTGSNEVLGVTDSGNGQDPTAVTLNDPSNVGTTQVTLTWSQNSNNDFWCYKVCRKTSAGVQWYDDVATLSGQSTTSYTDTGLVAGTTYYYKVFVFDVENKKTGSNEKSVTTQSDTAPTAVTLNDLTNVTSHALRLSWSQNSDGDFAAYKVYRKTSAGVGTGDTLVATIPTAAVTTCDDPGGQPGTTYYYKVFVQDTANLTTGSNEKSATTNNAPQPGEVLLLSQAQAASPSAVDLVWYNLGFDAQGQPTGNTCEHTYAIHRSTSPTFTPDAGNQVAEQASRSHGSTAMTYHDPDLNANTRYYYILKANTLQSNRLGVTTAAGDGTAPTVSITAPQNSATVSGTTAVEISATDNVGIASVKLRVDGELVSTATGYPYKVYWNTRTVSNAAHTLLAQAYDTSGMYAGSSSISVTVSNSDEEPPAVTLTAPDPEAVNLDDTVDLTADVTDQSTVAEVKFYVDGNLKSTDTAAPWLYSWDTTGEEDGPHDLYAEAKDAGDRVGRSALRRVYVRTPGPGNPPKLRLEWPLADDVVYGTVEVRAVEGFLFEPGITEVDFYVDDTFQQTDTTEPYWWNWDTPGETDGNHTVKAKGYYWNGENRTYIAEAEATVTVDNGADTTAPTVEITNPTGELVNVSGTVTIQASASDNEAVERVVFYLGLNVLGEDDTAPYQCSWDTRTILDDIYSLGVVAYDTSRNQAIDTLGVTVSNGTEATAPTCVVLSPAPNATVRGSILLRALAEDNVGVDHVSFYLDAPFRGMAESEQEYEQRLASYGVGVRRVPGADGAYQVVLDTDRYADGSHNLLVRAVDVGGQIGSAVRVPFTIANSAPTVSISYPAASATVGGTQVAVTVDYSDTNSTGLRINKLALYVDGSKKLSVKLTNPKTSGSHTFLWDSTGVTNGSHTLQARAYDVRVEDTPGANEGISSNVSVTVDNTNNIAPQPVVLRDAYNVTQTQLNLEWTKNTDTDFQKYEVHQSTTPGFTPGAGTLIATITSQSETFYHVSGLTGNTTYYFKVKVWDTNNNTSVSNEKSATTASSDATTPTVNATIKNSYDLAGNLVEVRDWLGRTTAEYDELNRDKKVTDVYGRSVEYTYDANGNRATLKDHDAGITYYTYDDANRLINVKDPSNHETDYTLDAAGQITRIDNSNGTYTLNEFNNRGWTTKITHKKSNGTVFKEYTYSYNKTGDRLRETDTQANKYVDYVYDNLHQLTRETKRNIVGSQDPYGQYTDDTRVYDYSYTFDEVGNRLTYKDEITQSQTSYTYNSMNQLTAAGNTTYTYDDNGNMVSSTTNQQTTNYQWDFLGHLIKVDNPGDTDVKFVYDGAGHRVKRWRQSGNETTYFVNDKTGDLVQLLAEVNSAGQTIARYIMGAALISQKRGGATYCYHFDALGSTRALTDASEVVQNTYEYDAYGNVLSKTENVANPYQFVAAWGYYADPDTGLLYLRARYYSPSIGRFISLDSYLGQASDPMSLHRYLYCGNNPLLYIDPMGNWDLPYWAQWAAAIGTIGVGLVLSRFFRGVFLAAMFCFIIPELALIEAPFAQFGMPGAGEAISVIFMGLLWALNMAASGLQAHLDASGKVWGTVKIIAEIAGLWIGYTALLWIIMNVMDLVDSRYP